MKEFRDNEGRPWQIAITIAAAKRVRDLKGVDLLQPTEGDPPLMTRIDNDPILLCDTVFCLVQPQAEQRGVTDEQFGAALGGTAILAMHNAFWQEYSDFFRELGRTDLATLTEKQHSLTQKAIKAAQARIEGGKLDEIFEALQIQQESKIQEQIEALRTPGKPSGK